MEKQPLNKALWNMLITQARAKFGTWPSLPASRWVHQQYVQRGGQFVAKQSERKKTEKKPAKGKSKKDTK
jgi:hypothetical protein